jgi:hypothetical protein
VGLDFTALIRYGGPADVVLRAIAYLETDEEDSVLAEVVACGLRNDFAFARHRAGKAHWRPLDNWEAGLSERPRLPCLKACLQLPSDFSLIFGRDAVWVYHTLRWMFFVKQSEWQRIMLGAVKRFCDLFVATDCIITSDQHPAVAAFRTGAMFPQALAAAAKAGEGEVGRISDLYIDKGYAKGLAFKEPDGKYSAIPMWDTHDYWCLPLGG